MLYVSGKMNDDLIEVTDSYEKKKRFINVGDALAKGTRIYGLHSNGTVRIYSSIQKFLDMYCMRLALCNSPVSYELGYDTQSGLIILRSCSLSDSAMHDLVIPDFVDFICGYAFEEKLNLRSVVIPKSVRKIGRSCFLRCENLESVVIEGTSDSELDMDSYVFMSCRKLRNVHLGDSVHTIPVSCFDECTSLHELQLPDSLVCIKDYAFRSSGLETIRIPDSVKVVGDAFRGCKNLRYAYIPDAIQSIEQSCFDGCDNLELEEEHSPKGLRKLASHVFNKIRFKN